ncbi:MAG: phosphoribosyl-AMP cyclohydrolase [Halobacteria archaeon]
MIQNLDQKIVRALRAEPASARTLAAGLGVSYGTLWRRVRDLRRRKVLRVSGSGRAARLDIDRAPFRLPPAKARAVAAQLACKPLATAVLRDWLLGDILMVAFMDRKAAALTLETGKATFFSRSRNQLWVKGETSGHFQVVKRARVDCDNDCLLLDVEPLGPACHTMEESCFFREIGRGGAFRRISAPRPARVSKRRS